MGLLLTVLCLALLPAVTTAQVSGEDPVSLQAVQHWLGEQPDFAETIDSLYTILGNTLRQPPPRGLLAAPFQALANDPAALQDELHATLASLPAWPGTDAATDALLTAYAVFYSLPDCPVQALPLPDSLDAAAAQIETAAAAVVEAFHTVLDVEAAAFLRNNHAQMTGLMQLYPFGGAFTGENMATLVQYMNILHTADHAAMLCAGRQWARFLDPRWRANLQSLLAAHPAAEAAVIANYHTPFGRIFFGGAASHNLLAGNVLFIADIGGDDIYGLRTRDAWSGLPQLIMDFAGNDIYDSLEPGGYAAGIGSISLLVDLAGNDTYHAESQTQGTGILGIGILQDLGGDDHYNAGAMAQGFSLYGAGMVLDAAGNDRYQVTGLGQGVGMTEGIGVLADLGGDDHYLATGLVPTSYGTPGLADSWSQGVGVGVRFTTPGGVGILQDHSGRDTYTAGSFSQGGGYYLGAGFFHDGGNDGDQYLGSRYNFGWGAHMGIGYFREEGGNDYYRTRQIVAAGLSWDLSLVLFEDLAGDDFYATGDFSLAAAAHRSIILFRDAGGSDTYHNALPARANQGPPNLSLFIDSGAGENLFDPPVSAAPCSYNNQYGFILVMPEFDGIDGLQCGAE